MKPSRDPDPWLPTATGSLLHNASVVCTLIWRGHDKRNLAAEVAAVRDMARVLGWAGSVVAGRGVRSSLAGSSSSSGSGGAGSTWGGMGDVEPAVAAGLGGVEGDGTGVVALAVQENNVWEVIEAGKGLCTFLGDLGGVSGIERVWAGFCYD